MGCCVSDLRVIIAEVFKCKLQLIIQIFYGINVHSQLRKYQQSHVSTLISILALIQQLSYIFDDLGQCQLLINIWDHSFEQTEIILDGLLERVVCVVRIETLLWTHPNFSYLQGSAEHAQNDHIYQQIDCWWFEEWWVDLAVIYQRHRCCLFCGLQISPIV